MCELKNFDPAIAVQAVENAAAEADTRLQNALQDALSLLRDAKEGIQALQGGAGPLLERAEHVFATTFELPQQHFDQKDTEVDAYLNFQAINYRVCLDPALQHGNHNGARVRVQQRYRAIVILEPLG
jgi:hypothetical protein